MAHDLLMTDIEDNVARVTLNDPDRHNALSMELVRLLQETFSSLGERDDVALIVLAAHGRSFCAGGDLAWMRAQFEATREVRIEEALKLARMLKALYDCPKPVIGRIQGPAFGGGLGMISVCDQAFASESAAFALTETRLGLIPATISPYVLSKLGHTHMMRIALAGQRFSAMEAARMGLIDQAVPQTALDAIIAKTIAAYLKCKPGAVSRTKQLIRRQSPVIDEARLMMSAESLADAWESPEAQEGISAFFAR